MPIDLVCCDIDGCLTPERPVAIDRASLDRIAARNQRIADGAPGAFVTLCSGRPQPFAELLCRWLANVSVPCIAENGVWLYHPGTNTYEMDPAISAGDLRAVRELEDWLRGTYAVRSDKGAAIQPGKSASISLYTHDHEWLVQVRDEVAAEVERRGLPLRISMTWYYLNCDLRHVSKATGVRRLAQRAERTRERMAGIGDTLGDLGIAEQVAWFACPGNADARLLAHAHYISPHHEAAGVADILDRLDRGG